MSQNVESFGKYILLEKVAMGGMAEVYLAKNQGAGGIAKFVAMKRILPQFSENINFIDMFKTEARIAVNLAHSNIVSIHEFGVEKDQFFIVMDFVEGRNLRQILNKMKKGNVTFSIEQILYTCKEIAGGLDHAHRCLDATTGKPLNIIHRDMSPQNVMVSFEGEVKIVDFGIAKAETQLETTRAGELKGKFGYMSPEQAEGLPVDLRTDIFSLGIVLWELLANDRLFIANNEVNTLRKIRECQVPSLRKINPNIPQELERIVGKALAKDRSLRYQTSAAFQRELSRFLNRQYPDFSPHDFSIFIKTLFASEILESRKKQIEYAKIEMPKQLAAAPSPEKTVVTETAKTITEQTESEPVTNTHGEGLADFGNADHGAKRKSASKGEMKSKEGSTPPPPSAKAKPVEITQRKKKVSDDIGAADLRVQRSPSFRDGPNAPVREGTVTGTNVPYGGTYYGTRSFSRQVRKKSRFTATTVMMAVMLGMIVGVVAVFLHNPSAFTTGLAKNLEKVGLYHPPTAKITSPGQSGVEEIASEAANHLSISTKPAGATILVDGVPYPDTTPTTVVLEPGETSAKITLQLPGYLPYNETVNFRGSNNPAINVALQSEEKGYLNVQVVGNGAIYVNNKFVAASGQANNIEVPANQTLQVKVYDQASGASDERMITVGSNKVQSVTLIPRAPRVRPEPAR